MMLGDSASIPELAGGLALSCSLQRVSYTGAWRTASEGSGAGALTALSCSGTRLSVAASAAASAENLRVVSTPDTGTVTLISALPTDDASSSCGLSRLTSSSQDKPYCEQSAPDSSIIRFSSAAPATSTCWSVV